MDDLPDNVRYDFGGMFMKSTAKSIEYQGKTLYQADQIAIPVKKEVEFRYRIVSTNSEWKQGFALKTDGRTLAPGYEPITRGWADIWEHISPKEGTLLIYSKKSGIVWLKNIWENPRFESVESWYNGAAMWFEDIPGGKRYHCNDGHFDDDFDEIVFELEIVGPTE